MLTFEKQSSFYPYLQLATFKFFTLEPDQAPYHRLPLAAFSPLDLGLLDFFPKHANVCEKLDIKDPTEQRPRTALTESVLRPRAVSFTLAHSSVRGAWKPSSQEKPVRFTGAQIRQLHSPALGFSSVLISTPCGMWKQHSGIQRSTPCNPRACECIQARPCRGGGGPDKADFPRGRARQCWTRPSGMANMPPSYQQKTEVCLNSP
ncbi:PREDICTED: uncharacterized protein LOC106148621 [Chinchilla lanigera]|uniref:uncharacterized protein LOC106148621 n=1 Tax=Chinchilla lanigera TaxID=34839 RepID=UPI0006974E58|nr:PREDICTED: uncharacterized protein LOC106148621 [Chinchilla lanigera]